MKKPLIVAVALVFVLAACGKEKHSSVTLGDTSASPEASASVEPGTSASPGTTATTAPKASSKAPTATTPSGSNGATASTPKPAAQGGVNPPKDGTYKYRTDGKATDPTNPSAGEQKFSNQTATSKSSHGGNVYTAEATADNRAGKTTTRTRWEATKISLISVFIETGFANFSCDYNPKPVIGHIPPKVETFPQQKLSGNGNACGGTLDISVTGKQTVPDATGKSWSTWVIHVIINSEFTYNGQKVTTHTDDTRWFSPDLGVEIRSHTKTNTKFGATTSGASDFTSVLKSHP